MPMAWRNVIAALTLLVLSIVYAVLTNDLPDRSIPNTPGPSFFPFVIVTVVALLSIALLISGVRGLAAKSGALEGAMNRTAWSTLLVFLIYLTSFPFLGFLLASIPFFAALMFLYGARKPLRIAAWSAAIPIVLSILFTEVFQILLPSGPLGF
jgi:putative tricarboxylic transport membrane protein